MEMEVILNAIDKMRDYFANKIKQAEIAAIAPQFGLKWTVCGSCSGMVAHQRNMLEVAIWRKLLEVCPEIIPQLGKTNYKNINDYVRGQILISANEHLYTRLRELEVQATRQKTQDDRIAIIEDIKTLSAFIQERNKRDFRAEYQILLDSKKEVVTRNRFDENDIAKMQEMQQSGNSLAEIAAFFCCDKSTIQRNLKKNGEKTKTTDNS